MLPHRPGHTAGSSADQTARERASLRIVSLATLYAPLPRFSDHVVAHVFSLFLSLSDVAPRIPLPSLISSMTRSMGRSNFTVCDTPNYQRDYSGFPTDDDVHDHAVPRRKKPPLRTKPTTYITTMLSHDLWLSRLLSLLLLSTLVGIRHDLPNVFGRRAEPILGGHYWRCCFTERTDRPNSTRKHRGD